MEKVINVSKINEEQYKSLLSAYENDFRDEINYNGYRETWIGLNGTTTMKTAILWDDPEEESCLYEYNVTIDALRNSDDFLHACIYNTDVNHSIRDDDGLSKSELQSVFDWFAGKDVEMVVTPCGLYNFLTEYSGYDVERTGFDNDSPESSSNSGKREEMIEMLGDCILCKMQENRNIEKTITNVGAKDCLNQEISKLNDILHNLDNIIAKDL